MIENSLVQLINIICQTARDELVKANVPTIKVDFIAVFTHSIEEFASLTSQVQGFVVSTQESGSIYELSQPMLTCLGPLTYLKIRKPDPTKPWFGSIEMQVVDYDYLAKDLVEKKVARVISYTDFAAIELLSSALIIIYIPQTLYSEQLNETLTFHQFE
jgi:hypothetical protein